MSGSRVKLSWAQVLQLAWWDLGIDPEPLHVGADQLGHLGLIPVPEQLQKFLAQWMGQ